MVNESLSLEGFYEAIELREGDITILSAIKAQQVLREVQPQNCASLETLELAIRDIIKKENENAQREIQKDAEASKPRRKSLFKRNRQGNKKG